MSHVLASSIFWAAVAVCAIAQFAIVRSALRARAGASSARSSPAAELLWVLLPALMLAATLLLTWRALEARASIARDGHAARSTQHAAALHPLPR